MLPSDKTGKVYMILNIITLAIILILCCKFYKINQKTTKQVARIETVTNEGKYMQIYNDRELVELKKVNEHLYDSIKEMKNEIDYLATFKYKYEHVGDTVKVNNDTINQNITETDSIKIFKYNNYNKTDNPFNYELTIGSKKPIDWYKLDFKLDDEFTIVNKKMENTNETTIESNYGEIKGDFIYSKSKRKTFKDRCVFGPSVTGGYDVLNKQFGIMIGFSYTFDIW